MSTSTAFLPCPPVRPVRGQPEFVRTSLVMLALPLSATQIFLKKMDIELVLLYLLALLIAMLYLFKVDVLQLALADSAPMASTGVKSLLQGPRDSRLAFYHRYGVEGPAVA
ncbi:hypothetical protein BASA81_012588 [Batrachochytrium salamandrivorans]|nr:hypothetical protein BASA81_012588 [Batrachochytrium salamandrivorans]